MATKHRKQDSSGSANKKAVGQRSISAFFTSKPKLVRSSARPSVLLTVLTCCSITVGDWALNSCISRTRQGCGLQAAAQAHIGTMHKCLQASEELPSPKRARTCEVSDRKAPALFNSKPHSKTHALRAPSQTPEAPKGKETGPPADNYPASKTPAPRAPLQDAEAPKRKAAEPRASSRAVAAPGQPKASAGGKRSADANSKECKRPRRRVLASSDEEPDSSGSEYQAASAASSGGMTDDSDDDASNDDASEHTPKAAKVRARAQPGHVCACLACQQAHVLGCQCACYMRLYTCLCVCGLCFCLGLAIKCQPTHSRKVQCEELHLAIEGQSVVKHEPFCAEPTSDQGKGGGPLACTQQGKGDAKDGCKE